MCKSEELRSQVAELLEATQTAQSRLCRDITLIYGYRVAQSELSQALNGKLSTPKAHRILVDGLSILTARRQRENILLLESRIAQKGSQQ